MRIAIAPAGTKTSAATIRALLDIGGVGSDAIQIHAFYRDPTKAPAEFSAHADVQILRGDIEDVSSLDFSGADAVLTSTPPVFDGRDLVANAQSVSRNVKEAIEKAGCVQKLVLLSSVGAQFSEGVVRRSRQTTFTCASLTPDRARSKPTTRPSKSCQRQRCRR